MLLALFIVTAAVVPVLISPDPPAKRVAAAVPTPAAVSSVRPGPTPDPTPSSTPRATVAASRFLVRPAVEPRPVRDPPRAGYREFQSVCAPVGSGTKVPLKGLAPTGRTVRYLIYGSTSAHPAEPGRVPGGSTSCVAAGDRSTYWFPVLYQGGRAIEPDNFTVYYKSAVDDYTSVQPFPAGLRMIVGGPGGAGTPGIGSWSCQGYDGPELPSSCPGGQRLTLRLSAPGCWDGRHLDVAGHRSHLARPLAGRCPAGHPVAIPALLVRIVYPLDGTGALRLASGPGDRAGFGFVAGWTPSTLAKLVRTCINAGRQCDVDGHG